MANPGWGAFNHSTVTFAPCATFGRMTGSEWAEGQRYNHFRALRHRLDTVSQVAVGCMGSLRVSTGLKRKILNDPFPIAGLATFDYDLKVIDDFGDAESPRNYQYSGDALPAREALGGVIRHRLLVMCNEYAAFACRPSQQVRIGCAAQARLASGQSIKTRNASNESPQYVVVEILIDEQSEHSCSVCARGR